MSETQVGEATTRSFGLSREGKRVPAVVAGGAERRKPDWPLHARAVRSMLTVG